MEEAILAHAHIAAAVAVAVFQGAVVALEAAVPQGAGSCKPCPGTKTLRYYTASCRYTVVERGYYNMSHI